MRNEVAPGTLAATDLTANLAFALRKSDGQSLPETQPLQSFASPAISAVQRARLVTLLDIKVRSRSATRSEAIADTSGSDRLAVVPNCTILWRKSPNSIVSLMLAFDG